jgi:hypothetical protein
MNGTHVVNDVALSDHDVRIAVETDDEGLGREGVMGIEWVADETSGVHCCTALKRRPGLDVVVEVRVVVFVRERVGGRARGRATSSSPWLEFGLGLRRLSSSPNCGICHPGGAT